MLNVQIFFEIIVMEINIYYQLVECHITCIYISLLIMDVCGDTHRPVDSCFLKYCIQASSSLKIEKPEG